MAIFMLRGLLGVAVLLALAWLMSSDRKRVPWRLIAWGMGLQLLLGLLVLKTPVGLAVFGGLAEFVQRLVASVEPATFLLFGTGLSSADGTFGPAFAFAAQGLPVIIFFAALMSVLYYIGIVQILVWVFARVMMVTMGVSGAEAMAMAANMFVGQTEAPLVVKPYLPKMTRSELNALMTGGFATVAGSVMAVYIGLFGDQGVEFGRHLLTASVMSAPAAFVIAKIMLPERETPETQGQIKLEIKRDAHNLIEAAANGTADGLKLWLNVIAMLIAFIALVALVDWPLGWVGDALLGMPLPTTDDAGVVTDPGNPLTLAKVFGWVLAPIAWVIGVQGWQDCQLFGGLLGTKIAINEFIGFLDLSQMTVGEEGGFQSARSAKMAAYALCGFANFSSIGIQIGGITPLAPGRKTDLSKLAFRAMLGGALASCCTAAVAGMFL
ncbi:CNT family concentrative nucleoside transporter [Algisphaera agarilytica]|uniref:CNT family concentrative nucleoside transporter n=1 Tax=Algisphaera agarilytica TaxID=1385975 RepID=A0A7X0H405_9BACT|nr:nucleoside transporter C-terminal domain-containing protein [Algisphaera agarilytica]MBB6428873.1 CNT family concentrative nucleoside transporter [Algisphaera agarilytica]